MSGGCQVHQGFPHPQIDEPAGATMDHHEQHHQHHSKQREENKKEQKEHERQEAKSLLPFHPAWLFAVGAVLVLIAVLVWTFLLR
jgi:hypothetical protein